MGRRLHRRGKNFRGHPTFFFLFPFRCRRSGEMLRYPSRFRFFCPFLLRLRMIMKVKSPSQISRKLDQYSYRVQGARFSVGVGARLVVTGGPIIIVSHWLKLTGMQEPLLFFCERLAPQLWMSQIPKWSDWTTQSWSSWRE